MFILPFLLAGIVMLGVLNPRFTVTLLQQTISDAGLLLIDAPRRRTASQYLFAHTPWTSTDNFGHSSYIPRTLPAASPAISFEPPSGRTCPFQMASSVWAAIPPTCRRAVSTVMSASSLLVAQVLVLFLLVVLMRRVYIGLVRHSDLIVRSSPRAELVEELRKQIHGQVFTSGSPQQPHDPSCGHHEDALSDACKVADTSLDVGLGAISGMPLALPSLVREIADDADSITLQPAKEAPVKVLPTSQTTGMAVLGRAPESAHTFIEKDFTNTSSSEREGSTFLPQATTSRRLTDDSVAGAPYHNVVLQPTPDA